MENKLPYQQDAAVYIETGTELMATLDGLLAQCGLLAAVEESWRVSQGVSLRGSHGVSQRLKDGFEIAIKMEQAGDLVLRLTAFLGAVGFSNVTVVTGGVPEIPRGWQDADFRLIVAKCRTDVRFLYSGCLRAVGSDLPAFMPQRHANGRRMAEEERCVFLAEKYPVHFGIVDAWMAGDGSRGRHPNATHTLMASRNILALDWVVGEKMNVDPAFNDIVHAAVLRWGKVGVDRRGNQTPWSPWKNASIAGAVWAGLTRS